MRVGEELMQLKAAAEAGAALCESLTKQVMNLATQEHTLRWSMYLLDKAGWKSECPWT